jgi:ssDNA-binding Zn-finger/Zn-ribbon topoisomerase 1
LIYSRRKDPTWKEESQKIKEKESRYLNKCLAYRICPICGDDLKVKRGGVVFY